MGSGSSKNKDTARTSTQNTARGVDDSPAKTQVNSISKTGENNKNTKGLVSEPLKTYEFGHKQLNGKTKTLDRNDNKTTSRIPQPFNDSDEEADDLLNDEWRNNNVKNRTTRNNNTESHMNKKIKTWEPPKPPEEDYPETYAQKMQREQYKKEQLIRQKTIYRNPDEWDIDEVSQQSFDVSKFKEANRTMPKTDIFGPLSNNDYSYQTQDDDNYHSNNVARKKSVPRYDISEEELMNDIETHYY